MKRRPLLIVLSILFAAIFAFSGINLLKVIKEYSEADAVYEQVQNEYVVTTPPVVPPTVEEEPIPLIESAGIDVDFNKLITTNKDVIGWLYCADTPINYPVVQGRDNSQYLHAGLNGAYLRGGTIFADYRNRPLGEDRLFILYGHSMKNKTMFGSLLGYKKQEYYDAHPVLYYLTPEAEYRVELFSGCVMKIQDILYQPNPGSKELAQYFEQMKKKSTFTSDVSVSVGDPVIVLSTCSYEFDNARYVVIGKLVKLDA